MSLNPDAVTVAASGTANVVTAPCDDGAGFDPDEGVPAVEGGAVGAVAA